VHWKHWKQPMAETKEKTPEVRVDDLSGNGTGPWRLLIGHYGVARWPCSLPPEEYAREVARVVRLAIGAPPEPPERPFAALGEAMAMEIQEKKYEAAFKRTHMPISVVPSRAQTRADLLRECIATGMFTRGTTISDLESRIMQELERGDE